MQKGSVNKVVLVGHLGGDPETRYAASGTAFAKFNLATNESKRGADGENQDKTEWHRIIMFGKSAELAGELLKKGQLVYLEGRIQTRNWEDRDGVKRYTTEIISYMFTMLGRKIDYTERQDSVLDGDEDIPFLDEEEDKKDAPSLDSNEDKKDAPSLDGDEDDLPF